jgi:hypothetical protein
MQSSLSVLYASNGCAEPGTFGGVSYRFRDSSSCGAPGPATRDTQAAADRWRAARPQGRRAGVGRTRTAECSIFDECCRGNWFGRQSCGSALYDDECGAAGATPADSAALWHALSKHIARYTAARAVHNFNSSVWRNFSPTSPTSYPPSRSGGTRRQGELRCHARYQ